MKSLSLSLLLLGLGACAPDDARSLSRLATNGGAHYPVVLHHGFLGFDHIFSVDYFYKVKARLEADGFEVYPTHVPAINTVGVRTAALAPQIDAVLRETGAEKVVIVAHSMGGLDARSLIDDLDYGDRVAALVTIGTPHKGTPVADAALKIESAGRQLRDAILSLFGVELGVTLGPVDADGALRALSTAAGRDFDATHPDDSRVAYESWSGRATLTGIGQPAAVAPLLWPTYEYLNLAAGESDGLIPVASARHGTFRGIVPADHFGEIGQLLGKVDHGFDYLGFYSQVAGEFTSPR